MKWISLRKQKPPLDTPILIFKRYRYGTIIKIAEFVRPFNKGLPKFGSHIEREENGTVYSGYLEDNVTHWMPLPAPPKFRKPYSKEQK